MNSIVLDASALLAVLNREAGADKLTPQLLSAATSSTVNLAEVQGKLVDRGLSPHDAWEQPLLRVVDTAVGIAVDLVAARICSSSYPARIGDRLSSSVDSSLGLTRALLASRGDQHQGWTRATRHR